jgi:putative glutathione S-transferase
MSSEILHSPEKLLARIEYLEENRRFIQNVLDLPGIRATVNIDHIKRGYYSIKTLNPNGIVPVGPELPFA